ncbi:hypothetical protein F66182_5608 [Fusarium sp. NRRL 66182]|nr:hypothetical protein F66182_5608 [Fusarium sp. NRRL 66182]
MTDSSFVQAQRRVAARRQAREAEAAARIAVQRQSSQARANLERLPYPLNRIGSAWDAVSAREGTRPAFRVGQVDAELLDVELLDILKEQVHEGLKYFGGGHLHDDWSSEIMLALRAVLFKLTVWDHDATYGAALQNLKYTDARNEGPIMKAPSKIQKSLYGLVTVFGNYAWTRWEDWLLEHDDGYDEPSPRLKRLSKLTSALSTVHSAAACVSFLVFLLHGRYRTLLDRILRMRLAPPTSQVSREVSFEYLNRQLVWHAFTEFLLFVLPLIGIQRWRRWLTRTWRKTKDIIRTGPQEEGKANGEYAFLPERTCAICYQDQNTATSENEVMAAAASSGVIGSAQTDITNPYETIPCGCVYCFVCLATRLEREEGEGWTCLRCGEHVQECKPWSGDLAEPLAKHTSAKTVAFSDDIAGGVLVDEHDEASSKPFNVARYHTSTTPTPSLHPMPSFFQFTQGTESHVRPNDSAPLLGRFRAVPPRPGAVSRRRSQLGLFSNTCDNRGSVHILGYGAFGAVGDDDDGSSDDELEDDRSLWQRAWQRWVLDIWVDPRQSAVRRVVDKWWTRYGFLVLMPALLAVAWCSIPFPQYPFDDDDINGADEDRLSDGRKAPGHGAARVQVNFWFFLFVYYGFYNITALIWITKVFNLYRLNWWPQSLGFPLTVSLIAILSIALPIPIYYNEEARFLTAHNTAWISWTFIIMALPVTIAFIILTTNERHIGLRHSLSETQRIFTTSWWTGEPETFNSRDRRRRNVTTDLFDPDLDVIQAEPELRAQGVRMRRRWLPASFVRFLWFCVALFIGLMAYVIGEAYAEIYLRTLPHNNLETVVYVYGWVATVHLLDALSGWVLGIREGERVGSYPLSWVFKLYFMLTYQTYVRALYARLRSPTQFITLQIMSSTGLVVITPIMMTPLFHKAMLLLGLNSQSFGSYQKLQVRNVFIRFLAENVSMVAFLGSILVLHFGANKDVYPYFAFDTEGEPYDFKLTFWASSVTWACELVASLVVRGLISIFFQIDVGLEGKLDLAVWPELVPTCVIVMLHVLQNMLFSIIRLQFQ